MNPVGSVITPAESLAKLQGYNKRIDRLRANEYSGPRFRTADMNRLKWEMPRIRYYISIAVHSKNPERSAAIVEETNSKLSEGMKFLRDYSGKKR